MEFNEKLQELRKSKGLTQEELAEGLYVSRTAISKWESGRGYPSIDSLKTIANYFSVTVDELLSADKIISIAEKENKSNIRKMCNMLFGVVDMLSVMLIFLPLYPDFTEEYIYSVNLFNYTDIASFNVIIYWVAFSVLVFLGCVKTALVWFNIEKGQKLLTACSITLSVMTVLLLGVSREAYAVAVALALLVLKVILLLKCEKNV